MLTVLGMKIDLEVSREFLEHAPFVLKYLCSRVLSDKRVIDSLAENKNISIVGPDIRDMSDETKGQRAGDLYRYSWVITTNKEDIDG